MKFNAGREVVREVPEYAGQTTPLSEQAAIHEAMNIPRYDPAGPPPPRLRTTAELIRDGVIHPPHDRDVGADAFVRSSAPSTSNGAESASAYVGTAPKPALSERSESNGAVQADRMYRSAARLNLPKNMKSARSRQQA